MSKIRPSTQFAQDGFATDQVLGWNGTQHGPAAAVAPTGKTGATNPSRYVGGTTAGHPTTGTFVAGDFVVTADGHIWVCSAGGTPGTWVDVAASGGAWTAYTPALTSITLGNGTVAGRYQQVGKTVHFTAQVTFGTTTTVGAGPIIGLPVTVLTGTNYAVAGYAYNNASGGNLGNYQVGGVCGGGSTNCFVSSYGGSVGATIPFTWASVDQLLVSGAYEAA